MYNDYLLSFPTNEDGDDQVFVSDDEVLEDDEAFSSGRSNGMGYKPCLLGPL